MKKAQAQERIEEAIEDAQLEMGAGHWPQAYSSLRSAADFARAIVTARPKARKITVPASVNNIEMDPRYSSSLERGLRILSMFTEERPILKLSEIADTLGYARSTTHRYLLTLLSMGQLEQTARRAYRLCREDEDE
jgi:Fic family protein